MSLFLMIDMTKHLHIFSDVVNTVEKLYKLEVKTATNPKTFCSQCQTLGETNTQREEYVTQIKHLEKEVLLLRQKLAVASSVLNLVSNEKPPEVEVSNEIRITPSMRTEQVHNEEHSQNNLHGRLSTEVIQPEATFINSTAVQQNYLDEHHSPKNLHDHETDEINLDQEHDKNPQINEVGDIQSSESAFRQYSKSSSIISSNPVTMPESTTTRPVVIQNDQALSQPVGIEYPQIEQIEWSSRSSSVIILNDEEIEISPQVQQAAASNTLHQKSISSIQSLGHENQKQQHNSISCPNVPWGSQNPQITVLPETFRYQFYNQTSLPLLQKRPNDDSGNEFVPRMKVPVQLPNMFMNAQVPYANFQNSAVTNLQWTHPTALPSNIPISVDSHLAFDQRYTSKENSNRQRTIFRLDQTALLEEAFQASGGKFKGDLPVKLALQLKVDAQIVKNWFYNRRAREKAKRVQKM